MKKSYKILFFLFVIFFLVVFLLTNRLKSEDRLYHQIGCVILSTDGVELKRFPGEYCIFLKDGSYISYANSLLGRISPVGEKIWEHQIRVHHQIKMSADEKFIFTISKDRIFKNKKAIDYEGVEKFDLNGKRIAKFSTFDNKSKLNEVAQSNKLFCWYANLGKFIHCEFSHANSVYEIKKNLYEDKFSSFAEGNIIVGLNLKKTVIILDPSLKKILFALKLDIEGQMHDVQVLENGKIAIYENGKTAGSSKIKFYDPLSKEVSTLLLAESSFSGCVLRGGFQQIQDGTWLLSDCVGEVGRISLIDQKGKVIHSYLHGQYFLDADYGKSFLDFQEVKLIELSDFFKNNKL